jgi:hypothetical protein
LRLEPEEEPEPMESESHSHDPIRRKDSTPVAHAKDGGPGGAHAHAPTRDELLAWVGFKVTDENGHSIGKVEDVYAVADEPAWLLVRHHLSHHFLAPIGQAIGGNSQVFLPFRKDVIESAPEVDPGAPASALVVAAAREHYGLG